MTYCFADLLAVIWLTGCYNGWLNGLLTDLIADCYAGWLALSLSEWLAGTLDDWLGDIMPA